MLWAGTDHGLSRFDGRAWTAYTAEDGLPGEAVSAVGVAADGRLWFGSSGGYISKYLPPDTEEAGN
jgi:ligand-binding sensor domain-containing protein